MHHLLDFAYARPAQLFVAIVQAYVAYFALLVAYRIFVSPLKSYPGPRLAAATSCYQFWYDVVQGGGRLRHLEALHRKYGPIVRIGPNELHFSDPHAFASIYSPGSKFAKDPKLYRAFAVDDSSFGYTNVQEAKCRRDIIFPLFSRKNILRLEDVVQENIDKMVNRALSCQGHPVDLFMAFRCTTIDIITSYCFAKSADTLSSPFFQSSLLHAMQSTIPVFWIFKYFPQLRFMLTLPDWLTVLISPNLKSFAAFRRTLIEQIEEVSGDPTALDRADREIIYHHLLTPNPDKGHGIPSKKSLLEEANTLVFAGSDTVGGTCTFGVFHVASDPLVYKTLVTELDEAWTDKESLMGYEALEKLPYLTAVIKESLRMSHGVVTPPPRIVGPVEATIAGTVVLIGTTVSIGTTFVHNNASIFSDPLKFDPARWLQPSSNELDRYLVAFSRGPRSCIGVNLAWCELYLIFGNVFRKMEISVYDTTVDDFKFREYFLPLYTGKPFRALLKERQ